MNPNQKYDSPNNHEQPGTTFSRTPSGVLGVSHISTFLKVMGCMPEACTEPFLSVHELMDLSILDPSVDWRNFYEATR